MESYTSGSSNETAWQSLIASLLGWVILDSYIYFAAVSGQFANVNPVELYTIGFYGFAILSGAVGGNLFRFLEISVSGHTIGRKQVFEGILFGSVVGFVLVFALYFIAPSLSIIGLPSNSLTVTAAVDPVPLSILHFYSVAFPSAYIIVFFLVVAIGEELMVLISFKSLDVTLRDWRLGGAVSILLALFCRRHVLGHQPHRSVFTRGSAFDSRDFRGNNNSDDILQVSFIRDMEGSEFLVYGKLPLCI